MKNKYTYATLIFAILAFLIIFVLSLTPFKFKENEILFSFLLQAIFVIAILVMGYAEAKSKGFSIKHLSKVDNIIPIALTLMLVSTAFRAIIGSWFIGIFIIITLFKFLTSKTFYKINSYYYFLFAYVLLQVVGTIGTRKGFHFPEILLSFLLVPISYSFFELEKKTLIAIAMFFVKALQFFLILSFIYWWYNFLHLDNVTLLQWISSKMLLPTNPSVLYIHHSNFAFTTTPAYFLVEGWSFHYHPTYTALVILFALIIQFYLRFNKIISKLELAVFLILSIIVIALDQSRIGFIGYCFVIFISLLYYIKLRTKKFKIALTASIILLCSVFFAAENMIAKFTNDVNRDYVYKVATSYVKEHFWWGCGFGQEIYAIAGQGEKMKEIIKNPGMEFLHSHNQFLGEMMKFGIFGVIVISSLFLSLFIFALRNRNYLLQLFLLVFILFMLIEEPFILQDGVTRFIVFLTFFMSFSETGKRKMLSLNSKKPVEP